MKINQLKPNILKFFLINRNITTKNQSEGLTILECLLAIMVVTVVISFISPIIFLSVATRVQNRRIEQAMELAQSEIDRVQVLMAQGVNSANEVNLPPDKYANNTIITDVTTVVAPTSVMSTLVSSVMQSPFPTNANQLRRIDINGDSNPDFLIQIFRDQGARYSSGIAVNQLAVFRMGVRVYSFVAEDNVGNLETRMADVKFATGLGQQTTNPLAVFYTEVSRSDLDLSSETYEEYLIP